MARSHLFLPYSGLILSSLLLGASGFAAASLFSDSFNQPDGLITNEYATNSASDPRSVYSPNWTLTSGSFFASGGAGWSGRPDATPPDVYSQRGTDSAIFRMASRRTNFGDVSVSFRLLHQGFSSTSRTPARDWDGVHLWLRHVSPFQLYAISFNRRDGEIVIKKKRPGGTDEGGTYFQIGSVGHFSVPINTWTTYKGVVVNNRDGSVSLALYVNGTLVLSARDTGIGGPPIRSAAAIGLRGDNSNFKVDDVSVDVYPAVAAGKPPVVPPPTVARPTPSTPLPTPPPTTSTDGFPITETDPYVDPSANGQSVSASPSQGDLSGARVFPNPWRADTGAGHPITFDHLVAGATVRLFALDGENVRVLTADAGGTATWDLLNDRGDQVGSGLYIYSITDAQDHQFRGKLAIIR